jgi:hypothetical protein
MSIPIDLARKHKISIGDLILFTDLDNGILIQKVIIEERKNDSRT